MERTRCEGIRNVQVSERDHLFLFNILDLSHVMKPDISYTIRYQNMKDLDAGVEGDTDQMFRCYKANTLIEIRQ